jgi:hypothetical protein
VPDRMPFLPPEIAKIFIISTLKSTMGEVDERYAARAASDRSAVFVKASATAMTGILIASASLFHHKKKPIREDARYDLASLGSQSSK